MGMKGDGGHGLGDSLSLSLLLCLALSENRKRRRAFVALFLASEWQLAYSPLFPFFHLTLILLYSFGKGGRVGY